MKRFTAYILFILIVSSPLLFLKKGEFLLWLNQFHSPTIDTAFKYGTHFGDGILLAICIILGILFSYRFAVLTILMTLLQTIAVQGMKRVLFPNVDRPKLFIENIDALHVVEGVNIHAHNSFPSGHATTAITLSFLLAHVLKPKYYPYILALGLFTALSRVYLLQHFFVDIWTGTLISAICYMLSILFCQLIYEKNKLNQSAVESLIPLKNRTMWIFK